jgi:acid phosphatase family membrane protein YuiD
MILDQISVYVWAIVIAWTAAHLVKYAIALTKGTQLTFKKQVFASGGMPSAHMSTVMALWAVILLKDGVTSGLFGVITLFALIVAHDAVRVRRSSGEQGVVLIELMKAAKSKLPEPRVSKGHSIPEVVVGVVFGVLVGTVVFFIAQ